MARKPASPQPPTGGIDLAFRPRSYSWPFGLEQHLLATVKGAERRAIGRLHPALMGGEYLPDRSGREVEIARIEIASVTRDVTSVYARPGKRRIYYRVVDEYDGATLNGSGRRTSKRPLTLGELARFLDGAWSVFDVLAMNFRTDAEPAEVLAFVRRAESSFYPDFGKLYRQRIEAWATSAPEP